MSDLTNEFQYFYRENDSFKYNKYLAYKSNSYNLIYYNIKNIDVKYYDQIIKILNDYGYNINFRSKIDFVNNEIKILPNVIYHEDYHGYVEIELKTKSSNFFYGFDYKKLNDSDNSLNFYFNFSIDNFNKMEKLFLNILDNFKKEKKQISSKINFLMKKDQEFYLKEFHLNNIIINEKLNYNLDNNISLNDIYKHIISNKSGFILFSGQPGTGKTTFIQYLSQKYQDKKFVFIPSHVAEHIADPSFLSFVITELQNSVLILEDSENLLMKRNDFNKTHSTSTLLNLTDGLLSKLLNVKIISTQNMVENIDDAFLRKGRLLLKANFLPLKKEQANLLAKNLNIDVTFDNDVPLSEIYNLDNNGNVKNDNKIGF